MKMLLGFLLLFANMANADLCWDQLVSCAFECCPKINGTWSYADDDCLLEENITDEEISSRINISCPDCSSSYLNCMNSTSEPKEEPALADLPSPTSICCAPAFLLTLFVILIKK